MVYGNEIIIVFRHLWHMGFLGEDGYGFMVDSVEHVCHAVNIMGKPQRVFFRVTPDLLKQIDHIAEHWRSEQPGFEVTRSGVIRWLVIRGVAQELAALNISEFEILADRLGESSELYQGEALDLDQGEDAPLAEAEAPAPAEGEAPELDQVVVDGGIGGE